jgi:pyruvate/2-oxoglutarate/acetoin dehydrogenase E1 component/TPP-dependent pyruvate/acetoin dehydrogenase alpha subunit
MDQEKVATSAQEATFVQEVLADYTLACQSREASLLGRKEVLTGKAKFGIFGDGKEIAQIAMSKQFKNGDFRSGYYRDQTFMMAIGQLTVQQAFAALYAHTNIEKEPASGGRQMGGHFATRSLNPDGTWKDLTAQVNSSADISPTAGQMPRLLGLAQASKYYRNAANMDKVSAKFSKGGNEVAFGTIGDASTSEGLFFETMNAAGVLQVPMVMSVWDDGYGISVPKKYQTTKGSISELLKGLQRDEENPGFEIYKVKGWDYVALVNTYEKAVAMSRETHTPALIHVEELTQPQGHSTSGSHERYKSEERLAWAKEFDCIAKMKSWILKNELATEEELAEIEKTAKKEVRAAQKLAWSEFQGELNAEKDELIDILNRVAEENSAVADLAARLVKLSEPTRKEILSIARKAIRISRNQDNASRQALKTWVKTQIEANASRYSANLYSESANSPLRIDFTPPSYSDDSPSIDGRLILRDNFEVLFERHPEILTFGEDVGKIGGVNQSMEGMQDKFGEIRVSDTGIREATIIGQGIGMAMRGLRPIAEIQYLDYLLYAIQIMSDDLATVRYRTHGGQMAPLIIRTRGHRLEGVWHSGSPMGMIINAVRGIHVCVPRNMTTAAGMYNTLLQGDDPALVIEPLNGYRTKEICPDNLGDFTIPLGVPQVLTEGSDLTLVSYGSTCNLAMDAVKELEEIGISVELIDVRTLLPFDTRHIIKGSIEKTSRLLIVDEDVPGGASAYMLDKILNEQKAYFDLDSLPYTLAAKAHRPAYGSDGDYFSKPSIEDIVEKVIEIMNEAEPARFAGM